MRPRYLAAVALLVAGGCLVPRYDYEPVGADGSAGSAATAGASAGGSGGNAGSAQNDAGKAGLGEGGGAGCTALEKDCGGECVAIDDPVYGCTPTSCDASTCPVAGEGELGCEAGACVIASCGAGSKKCDGKCVSIDDPSYGCGETACDPSACPDPAGGTVICNQGVCEIGQCTAETKACNGKCVPKDRNNGCNDPTSCEPCTNTESCGVDNAACECYATDPCQVLHCGEAIDRCGKSWQCGSCNDSSDICHQNYCVDCLVDEDCGPWLDDCIKPTCGPSRTCYYANPPANTACHGGGTCSTEHWGVCERAPIAIGPGGDIDAFEVTRGQYEVFVQEMQGELAPGLPAACSWKTSHSSPSVGSIEAHSYPVTRVDWCDAYGYCSHVGRRLCGKPGGGVTPYATFAQPANSQWTRACQGASGQAFPYGPSYVAGTCHDTSVIGFDFPVGYHTSCEGGYDGVFDLSGSVDEWEDSCDGTSGTNDLCRLRGGSFTDEAAGISCNVDRVAVRHHTSTSVGFRCCSK